MLEFEMRTDLQAALPQVISFNFEELKNELAERLTYYNELEVTEATIKDAKTDRANLNKLRSAIDTRMKDVKKEWLKPFNDFEAKCKELTVLIDEPIKSIDNQLQVFEDRRKEEKMAKAQELYAETIRAEFKDIIPFERILDQSWLNATTTLKKVKEDLENWDKRVAADMLALDAIEDEYKLAVRETYIKTLDVSAAIAQRDSLKAAEEAFKAREEQKAAAEAQKTQQEQKPAPEPQPEPQQSQPAPAETQEPTEKKNVVCLEFTMTKAQAVALKDFLDRNNITYRKVR